MSGKDDWSMDYSDGKQDIEYGPDKEAIGLGLLVLQKH